MKRDLLIRVALANGFDVQTEDDAQQAMLHLDDGPAVQAPPPTIDPPRFVDANSGEQPPEGGKRFLMGGIEETWKKVYDPRDPFAFRLMGWMVTQRFFSSSCDCHSPTGMRWVDGELMHPGCGRHLAHRHSDAGLIETIKSLRLSPSDEIYNMTYPTLKGHTITHGRREHRELTKDMVHMGPGWSKDFDASKRHGQEKAKRQIREKLDRWDKTSPRKLGEV